MRQIGLDWIENRFPCYMWKTIDQEIINEPDQHAMTESEEADERSTLLSDGVSYYFGDPAEVNKHLATTSYSALLKH